MDRWLVTATVQSKAVNIYGPLRDYEYRIKANCADGESEYGPIGEFSIPTASLITGIANSREKGADILIGEVGTLYPNPVQNNLNLSFITFSNKADFLIYDNTGKLVFEQRLVAGSDYYNFSIGHLDAGLYLGVVRENGKVSFSERIVKQ